MLEHLQGHRQEELAESEGRTQTKYSVGEGANKTQVNAMRVEQVIRVEGKGTMAGSGGISEMRGKGKFRK